MKRLVGITSWALVGMLGLAAFPAMAATQDALRQQRTAMFVHEIVSQKKLAYSPVPLTDENSRAIGRKFLESLDGSRLFFVRKDVDRLLRRPRHIELALSGKDLSWMNEAFDLYAKRQQEGAKLGEEIAASELDLETPDVWEDAPEQWPTAREMKERWRLSVKDDIIAARLAGASLEDARKKVAREYQQSVQRTLKMNQDQKLELFLSNYVSQLDPHSAYLSPRSQTVYKAQLHHTLDGVGVVFAQAEDKSISVRSITPGSAAAENGVIQPGFILRAVGPAPDKMKPISGMDLMEVVDMVKGPVGTSVALEFATPQASAVQVSLVRSKIRLADNVAKRSDIVLGKDTLAPFRIAVIKLPLFYEDNSGSAADRQRPGGSMANDTKAILRQINSEPQKPDAILLDLRGNGGGIINEAINLVGLFAKSGPVVQLKNAQGKIQLLPVVDNEVLWTGPLALLINDHSASASEITAAALQDMGRAIVLGQTSYGKGSAQMLLDLDQVAKAPAGTLGQLNLTYMMFFRPNGPSTQMRGVVPDVVIGTPNNTYGERRFENALGKDSVSKVDFVAYPTMGSNPWQARRVQLQKNSKARFSSVENAPEASEDVAPENKKSLVWSERESAYRTQQAQAAARNAARQAQGQTLADGAGGDITLREAAQVVQEAFAAPPSTSALAPAP